jgi:hypothetical protein
MSVKGPRSPLSSGAEALEPLNSKDLQKLVKSEKFESALSQLENQAQTQQTEQSKSASFQALENIANGSDLSSLEGAMVAVRQSAGYMISKKLKKEFLDSDTGKKVVDDLSEYVAGDPSLQKRLLGILQKMRDRRQN